MPHSPNITFHAHSATVRIGLLFAGRRIEIAQLGPDFLILQDPTVMPPGMGEIILQVDESERRKPVLLPNGIGASVERTPIQNCT